MSKHTVIIAGSRTIQDKSKLMTIIANDDFCQWMDELVHGGAKGVDTIAEEIIREHWDDTEVTVFEPDWDEHGKAAGPIRNQEMAEYADKLLAIWDGESSGTHDMIDKALDAGLDIHIENLEETDK